MRSPLRVIVGLAAFAVLTAVERKDPLRRRRFAANRRLLVNAAMGGLALACTAPLQGVLVGGAMAWAERHRVGVCRWLRLPRWLAGPTAVLLLDYTLWHWHRWNHASDSLWRLHAAHHADLDLDASTALRFHPGELVLSVPYRALQVCAIGATRRQVMVWETLVMVLVQFHHSNVELPAPLERALGWILITPRIHGIHHSRRPGELHTNFGTILSVWDRLHGSRVEDVAQESIDVGLPGQGDRGVLGLVASLGLSFAATPPRRS